VKISRFSKLVPSLWYRIRTTISLHEYSQSLISLIEWEHLNQLQLQLYQSMLLRSSI